VPPLSAKKIVAGFEKWIEGALRDHDALVMAVFEKTRQASLESLLAEQLIMWVAVRWEAMVHELIVTLVVGSPRLFWEDLESRMKQSMEAKFGDSAKRLWKCGRPADLTKERAASLLDHEGRNITVKSASALPTMVERILPPRHAKKFVLDESDGQVVDLLIKLRNYLAHRSESSREELAEVVDKVSRGGANGVLAGPIGQVATYLKSKVPNQQGTMRAVALTKRVREVAKKLA
jgi:hypothetical protein